MVRPVPSSEKRSGANNANFRLVRPDFKNASTNPRQSPNVARVTWLPNCIGGHFPRQSRPQAGAGNGLRIQQRGNRFRRLPTYTKKAVCRPARRSQSPSDQAGPGRRAFPATGATGTSTPGNAIHARWLPHHQYPVNIEILQLQRFLRS